jgi:hypothetical protein
MIYSYTYILTFVSLVLLLFLLFVNANADTKQWGSGSNGDWSVDSNWNPPGVPTSEDDVYVFSVLLSSSSSLFSG